MNKNHPFHLVTSSPWPLLLSMNILTTLTGITMWMMKKNKETMMTGMILTTMIMSLWWRDIVRESTFQGNHTKSVVKGLKIGMIMFILSEVMFFFSMFWSFFHSSLSPSIEIGMNWPPKSIKSFNPMEIPLLNTIILLSSGASVTWAHQEIIMNKYKSLKKSMMLTITLGVYFSILQEWEYKQAPFTIADSVYGATFFVMTGFHGLHVIIGTIFLLTCMIRMNNFHLSSLHHFGFEAAAWYWHFVDVVWIFLYVSVYWWGK